MVQNMGGIKVNGGTAGVVVGLTSALNGTVPNAWSDAALTVPLSLPATITTAKSIYVATSGPYILSVTSNGVQVAEPKTGSTLMIDLQPGVLAVYDYGGQASHAFIVTPSALSASLTASKTYGLLGGRSVRARAGGRDASYNSVTTNLTSFTGTTIPLGEAFLTTGLAQGTNGITIPSNFTPGYYDICATINYTGGATGARNIAVQVNGSNASNVNGYGSSGGLNPTTTFRTYLYPGDLVTVQGYTDQTSVSVVANSATGCVLDVTRVDRLPVQPLVFGYQQSSTQAANLDPSKREIINTYTGISAWTDVAGIALTTDSVLAGYVSQYPARAQDAAVALIPHGLGSGTWTANLNLATSGAQDSYYVQLGQRLAQYGAQTVYARPWWEFNISTAQPNAAAFIAAWQHAIPVIRTAFAAAAPTKTLKIAWSFSEGADPRTWWPGASYVDIITADVYAMIFGTTTPSLSALCDKMNVQLSILAQCGAQYGMPIAISEFAQCAVQPGPTTFQGVGDTPAIMDLYFDFFENAGPTYASYFNYATGGVGVSLSNVPNTLARLNTRRSLLSRLG